MPIAKPERTENACPLSDSSAARSNWMLCRPFTAEISNTLSPTLISLPTMSAVNAVACEVKLVDEAVSTPSVPEANTSPSKSANNTTPPSRAALSAPVASVESDSASPKSNPKSMGEEIGSIAAENDTGIVKTWVAGSNAICMPAGSTPDALTAAVSSCMVLIFWSFSCTRKAWPDTVSAAALASSSVSPSMTSLMATASLRLPSLPTSDRY